MVFFVPCRDLPPNHGRSRSTYTTKHLSVLWKAPTSYPNPSPLPNLHFNKGWASKNTLLKPCLPQLQITFRYYIKTIFKMNYFITVPVPISCKQYNLEKAEKTSPILQLTRQVFHKERAPLDIQCLVFAHTSGTFQKSSFVVWNLKMAPYSAIKYPFESLHVEENSCYFQLSLLGQIVKTSKWHKNISDFSEEIHAMKVQVQSEHEQAHRDAQRAHLAQ